MEAIAAALKAANADVLIEPSYQIETEGILQKPLIVDPVPCAIIAAKGY